MGDGGVDERLLGAIESTARPTADPAELGTVRLDPTSHQPSGRFEANGWATLRFDYRAGRLGIDDSGHLKIAFRWTYDGGRLQTEDPAAPNYVSAQASNRCPLSVTYDPDGHTRPFDKAVLVTVRGGFLGPGDRIEVVLGDRAGGSPGLRVQTFAEQRWDFLVMVDACATNHFVRLPERCAIAVEAGEAVAWRAVLPTRRRIGETFFLGLRVEDGWGNPAPLPSGEVAVTADHPVDGLLRGVALDEDALAQRIGPLRCNEAGVLRIGLRAADGSELAESNPLVVVEPEQAAGWWADLHAQSGETVGIDSIDHYFGFARDVAFLDVCGHQGNDFQITNAFWQHLNEVTRRFDRAGRFVAIPGYEWSGNTAVGGDRNVLFRREGRAIRRSSHALVADHGDIADDAPTAEALFGALRDEDAVCIAHVGGRYADIRQAHDRTLERSVEVHSNWGTFEWLLADAFECGYRVGVACNSDGHKGRPGASHPGASSFGAYGGLTCLLADRLDRDAMFEALRRRRHYGTTGCRLDLDVRVHLDAPADLYADDPATGAQPIGRITQARMGDIVRTAQASVRLEVAVEASAPIERLEIRRGLEVLETVRPYAEADLGDRIRLRWEGARYRGRGRQQLWQGSLRLDGGRIEDVRPFNIWNHAHFARQTGPSELAWRSVTSGNFAGADLMCAIDQGARAELHLDAGLAHGRVAYQDIGLVDHVIEAGGLGLALRLFRLPDHNPHRSLHVERRVERHADRDTPLYVALTTEDGHMAWSSPIYLVA
ncbi:MAG: DUF3604 domain-containing protein [Alphaproteobacteria bacterium]|nr:DUF3604 domain-containing protein [Alphaproteobacteria bacterium]